MKKLLQVKSLVTLSLTLGFLYLSLKGTIESKDYFTVFCIVITYYFNKRDSDENGTKNS